MAETEAQQVEALIITDASGAVYAVPRPLLEAWRLPDERAAALREQKEVDGYGVSSGMRLLGATPINVDAQGLEQLTLSFQKVAGLFTWGKTTDSDDWQAG
jgi:hypothetical protein